MNDQPIEQAQDDDLRQSRAAMMRAAERARELAERTGTELVVARGREVAYLKPEAAGSRQGSQVGAGDLVSDAAVNVIDEVGGKDSAGTAASDGRARKDEASRG